MHRVRVYVHVQVAGGGGRRSGHGREPAAAHAGLPRAAYSQQAAEHAEGARGVGGVAEARRVRPPAAVYHCRPLRRRRVQPLCDAISQRGGGLWLLLPGVYQPPRDRDRHTDMLCPVCKCKWH